MKTNIFDLDRHEGYQSTNNILELLKKDTDIEQVVVFPELANKKIGLPNGTMIQSKKHIYPFAVPDPGCGYRIILTNLYTCDLTDYKINILNELVDKNGLYNRIRENKLKTIDFEKLWRNGINSLEEIDESIFVREDIPVFSNNIHEELSPNEKEEYMDNFALSGSPFLEFRYADNNFSLNEVSIKRNQIIVVIHLGTLVGKKVISGKYLESSILNTLRYGIYDESDIYKQLFFLDYDSEIGKNYLDFVNFMINYAYASRQVSSTILNRFLDVILKKKVEFKLISDLTHSSISRRDSKIYHARGLQITSKKNYPLLIGGETNTHSYLVFSKSENIYISHGTGKYIDSNKTINLNNSKYSSTVTTNREYYYDKDKETKDVTTSIRGIEDRIDILCKLNPFINYWNDI
ncbi:RtcB family protein [Enterococcus casseliflavus]|uniref:RtcB family protein n=1 Tax=Enterococcus casseliflavus TaxID=37734 RepID=UPI0034D25CB6